jgi:hypothetical protein
VEWEGFDFRRPVLTVLATDLRSSTRFLNACTNREVQTFFSELGSLTKLAMEGVDRRTREPSRIDSFVGDGFLMFFAESDPQAAERNGPARALVVAKELRKRFRVLCERRFGNFQEPARNLLREIKLVSAITHGEVLYGPFADPALPGNTGMLSTVVSAFRLTKIRWPEGDADDAVPPSRPRTLDYIVVCDNSLSEIKNIQSRGAIGRHDTGDTRPDAPKIRRRLVRELDDVTFVQCRRNLPSFENHSFHEAVWPA